MRLSDMAEPEKACPSRETGGNIATHVAFVVIVSLLNEQRHTSPHSS